MIRSFFHPFSFFSSTTNMQYSHCISKQNTINADVQDHLKEPWFKIGNFTYRKFANMTYFWKVAFEYSTLCKEANLFHQKSRHEVLKVIHTHIHPVKVEDPIFSSSFLRAKFFNKQSLNLVLFCHAFSVDVPILLPSTSVSCLALSKIQITKTMAL